MAKASQKTEIATADTAQVASVEAATQADEAGAIDAELTAAANAADAPRFVRARVLAFCTLGSPDDVIEIEADLVGAAGDVIDTDPAAVAYAESLKG